ncbi:MAG: DUF4760 domain-containing protein [Pseudomonadota bacterium]
MNLYEWLNLTIMAISVLCVAGSLFYLAKQVQLFSKANQDNHDWRRRIATQHVLDEDRKLNTDGLNIKFGFANRKSPIPLEEMLRAFKEEPSLQMDLHKLLNSYEGLANGVFFGTYDEKIIKVNRSSSMQKEFTRCRYYIDHRRNETSRTAWSGYQKLIEKWQNDDMKSIHLEPTGNLKT